MKITTDAQAQAARKKLDALKEWDYAFQKECKHPEIDILKAALAAYEAQKAVKDIVLSEEELLRLRHQLWEQDGLFTEEAGERLWDLGLMINCKVTPAGRAYLASLTQPKRELKWEVWNKTTNSLRCSCDDIGIAEIICKWHNEHVNVFTYEVREVK